MSTKRDYYDVLGLSRGAKAEEIKRSYRKLARQFHPDVNRNDPTAETKFKEVQEAYDVLSDEKKPHSYDQFGQAGVDSAAAASAAAAAAQAGRGAGGFRYATSTPGGATVDFGEVDMGDLFEQMMGGMPGRGRGGPRRGGFPGRPAAEEAIADLIHEVTLSFQDAVMGTQIGLTITNPNGRQETLSIKIPAGVEQGKKIRLRGRGNPGPHGRGDLILVIKEIQPHAYFTRQGQDLLLDLPVSLSEAVLGATLEVPTLEGKKVTLRIPPGLSSGKKLRIPAQGVPQADGSRGDQFCRVMIQIPGSLTDEQKQQIQAIDAANPYDPRRDLRWWS